MAGKNSNRYGYPLPGPQNISVYDLMTSVFFMSEDQWNEHRKHGNFDYVVVGSSFCALGFTQRMLEKNPEAKILILERGKYFYLEHFQNLPPSYQRNLVGISKRFHWKITEKMRNGKYIKWLHGMNNFFGGQSVFWRGWCPKPTREELDGWPEKVKDIVEEYFPEAARLLNVMSANQIGASDGKSCKKDDHQCVFGELQNVLVEKIRSCLPEAIKRVDHASLAVRADKYRYESVQKFSVPDPLLNLLLSSKCYTEKGKQQPLEIKRGCLVEKILQEDGRAVALKTNKGDFKLGDAKLILAMGALPPTTLMLNSFPSSSFKKLAGIGTRFTAHFMSSVIARVPVPDNVSSKNMYYNLVEKIRGKVEMAAVYIPGLNPNSKHQFHIQLSAIIDDTPVEDIYDTMRHFPDVSALPSMEQLASSKDPPHVVFVCKSIGELDHANKDNWYRLNSEVPSSEVVCCNNTDITCNTTLQVVANDVDHQLWDTMDDSTFEVLESLDSRNDPNGPSQLEYWHSSTQSWQKERPPTHQIRTPGLVHEASTMWIGDDESSPVGLDYRFRGVDNVYLTGAALWPTGGSWNPTCTMTALAINLADKLNNNNDIIKKKNNKI